ncbi:MAG: alpha/beta hydrolase [Sedimentisphaerales bacterium]|nr:alpha/beta hydrolase [Sedimentisphaerales bacterium]
MGSLLLYLGVALAAVYVGWGLVLLFLQPRLLYRPVRDISFTPADLDLDFEDVTFNASDGVALNGWYVPAAKSRFTILFCHGNGGNIMHRLDTINLFHNLGLSCFIFDYRGYGKSAGRPTEVGTYRDAEAAYEWLTRAKRVPAEQIVLFGRSLGGSVAANLACRVEARALVIESAFTSYPDIGAKFYPYLPVRLFACFKYNTLAYVSKVRCPILIMHSRDDELVPFEFGTRLFEAAQEPRQFVEIFGGHNDGFLLSSDIYKDAWIKWLDFLKTYRREHAAHMAS